MTKVINFSSPTPPAGRTILDKLAQLSPETKNSGRDKLKKRAKAKFFTGTYLRHLIDLDSPLKKSYTNTLFCCHTLHQVDDKITSKYCNNRWCIVCNRIRIGKAINGYLPQMKSFADPFFVTLTIPNVKASELRTTISTMIKAWRLIYKCLKKRSLAVRGIRKMECTYNPDNDDYHPHFHFIIDGKELAETIVAEWLQRFPAAVRKAQDITPANEGSMLELFKYFTKILTKQKLYISALDQIFQAMAGLRVFQPFGVKKVSEEVEELQAEIINDLVKQETFWEWCNCDWVDKHSSEHLTGYVPSIEVLKLIENIVY